MNKNKKPLVSFLITAYNAEDYIEDCIQSCLNQDYTNIEICVVDDGSEDKTFDIIMKYGNFKNIKFANHENNKGKIHGFNTAFSLSHGEFIAILGADDINYKNRISVSLNNIKGAVLLCGNLNKVDQNLNMIESNIVKNVEIKGYTTENLINSPKVFGGTILLKRNICEKIFPLDIRLAHEDWFLPIAASLYGKINYVDKPLIAYRIHDKNSSKSSNYISYKKWMSLLEREEYYYQHMIDLIKDLKIKANYDLFFFNYFRYKMSVANFWNKIIFYVKNINKINSLKIKTICLLHFCPFVQYLFFLLFRNTQIPKIVNTFIKK